MLKFTVGFIFGLMTLSALAQSDVVPTLNTYIRAGGDGIDGRGHVIQTDAYGYVICSQIPPPQH